MGVGYGNVLAHLDHACPSLLLTGIDSYDGREDEYEYVISSLNYNVRKSFIVRGHLSHTSVMFHDSVLDFIFIDDEEENPDLIPLQEILDAWIPKLKSDGWVVHHGVPAHSRIENFQWEKGVDNVWIQQPKVLF